MNVAVQAKTNGAADWNALPEQLRAEGLFCLYRNVPNGDGKPKKVPFDPKSPNSLAKVNDPATWADWETTQKAFGRAGFAPFAGINAVCHLPFVFVDLDKCVDQGKISQEANAVIAALPETYWETSPSGTGLHGIFYSKRAFPPITQPGVEVYSDKHFMSVTGLCVNGVRIIAKVTARNFAFLRKTTEANPANGSTVIAEGQRNDTLVRLAYTLRRHKGLKAEELEAELAAFNAAHCVPPLSAREIRTIVKSTGKQQAELLEPSLTDVGNAERLLIYSADMLRYLPAFKRWAVYDGLRWPVEDREQEAARALAHRMVVEFILQAAKAGNQVVGKFAFSCLNTSHINCMLREAQCKAILRTTELDADRLLVNLQNGTLDARTMKMRAHCREDYITSVIPYEYNPEAECPRWKQFIKETFGDDQELIEFVQRALGYSMTADTREKCVFLAHGPTDTGKTTLLTAVSTLLGEGYAGRITVESLMIERGRATDNNAQADLADLRGKRFVNTSETGQGQQLRESLVKVLVQGQGSYRAVRKYENPFDFPETWKIWMDCNHLPGIRDTDDAIWQRLMVIPFKHAVATDAKNPKLGAELLEEAEGILAWLVEGLRKWMKDGLQAPSTVVEQRQEWREESDVLKQWLAECCVVRGDATTPSLILYESYKAWRKAHGLYEESTVMFARNMKAHRFEKKERGARKVPHWFGVGIITKKT
jgi:putative DNA primase/helicase